MLREPRIDELASHPTGERVRHHGGEGHAGFVGRLLSRLAKLGRERNCHSRSCHTGQCTPVRLLVSQSASRDRRSTISRAATGGGDLVYAGKVGTGFDDETLDRLGGRLRSLARETPPFDRGDLPERGVHWVRPDLVCSIGFTAWTDAGRLRHPRYLGRRRDKDPEDVVRETPRSVS